MYSNADTVERGGGFARVEVGIRVGIRVGVRFRVRAISAR